MLTPRATRALLDSGLSRLIVSCDAVTDQTYRIVRPPGGHLGAARQRLGAFIGAWRAAGRPLEVVLRFVELDGNVAEREADALELLPVAELGRNRFEGTGASSSTTRTRASTYLRG